MPNTSQVTNNSMPSTVLPSSPKTRPNTSSSSPAAKYQGKGGQKQKNTKYGKKHHKPAPKPVVKRGPINEYVSVCCSLPAEKPACGSTLATQTEGKKVTKVVRGLGHFRCTGCRKGCKVTARKPQTKTEIITVTPPAMDGVPMGEPTTVEVSVA